MVMEKSLSAEWTRIRGRLRAEYGEAAYRSWLKPLTLCGFADNRVKLSAPTRFMRDWVDSQYGDRLARLWKGEIEEIEGVDLILEGVMSAAPAAGQIASPIQVVKVAPGAGPGSGNDIGAPLDPRFTFANFIVGKPNELAFAAARRVAEASVVPFNPLFLYGGVGLSKTHLMHAIA